jgi:putative membrane-bound dehydrogenase-like protein
MTLPAGFHATLFAGEPDVVQPIAFTFDDRGRLWVVECLSYPNWTADGTGHDRVVIFEDTDGDGRFDKKTVFWDQGSNLSGIALGFGGVWLCSTPNLVFLPVKDGEDKPAGPPEVVLDGWNLKESKHNVFNGLVWGPDGWLWGCNGIQSRSKVGRPGTPDAQRVEINCGVWRYHPTRKVFEAVAHGTTNPWGLDFDDFGEAFITNCVIGHLWHVVPGAHFERMYGQDINPHSYAQLKTCADHLHWAGGPWTESRTGQAHSDAGGGHAHVGCMVYLGDNWPAEYRNGVFTCNLHGNRVNHDVLERRGSTYVAHHGKDFLFANDPWFRGLAIQYGPDGGVYVSDWTDTGECHNYVTVDRTNGRIYKVSHGTPKPWHGDLAKLSDEELVKLQRHPNDWFVRHARRLLQERAAAGTLAKETHGQLRAILDDARADVRHRLRALWALHATVGLNEKQLRGLFRDGQEEVRAWAVRLSLDSESVRRTLENGPVIPPLVESLTELVHHESSPRVRLALASGLQRLPVKQRGLVAAALNGRSADADDPYIPLMIWYGIEPEVAAYPNLSPPYFLGRIPLIREFTARRLAAGGDEEVRLLTRIFTLRVEAETERDILRGLQAALAGRRQVPKPNNWDQAYGKLSASPSEEVRERALQLGALFGDAKALETLRRTAQDARAPAERRRSALQTLLQRQDSNLVPLLHGLLTDPAVRSAAIRGLAAFADPGTPALLLKAYPSLPDAEKADAVQTLASRPAYALALLDAVEKGQVPRRDVSVVTVRQLQALKSPAVAERVTKVWGTVRPASKEKAALMSKFKGQLTPDTLKSADRSRGRAVFVQHCATCHRLFDDGGKIGPELTGSQRANLEYVLENVLDPSAVVAKEYQVTNLELKNGRVLSGIVTQETDRALTMQMVNEAVTVPRDEIEVRTLTPVSMMPEGLFEKMTAPEVRDLVAYLASPAQVPLPRGEPGRR